MKSKGSIIKKYKTVILMILAAFLCLSCSAVWQEKALNLSLTAVLWKTGLSDQKNCVIPSKYPLMIFSLGVLKILLIESPAAQAFWGMLSAAAPLLFFYLISGGRAMGAGDVKLMAAAGFYLGSFRGLLALFLGSLAGSIVVVFRQRRATALQTVAFGPYLSLGIWISALFF